MKKTLFLSLFLALSFLSFSQQNSAYVKGLLSFGLQEYSLPAEVGLFKTYHPGQALAAELGVNVRLQQFEITPHFGYSFNSEGYESYTDSGDFSGSYRLTQGYLGLGAFYAVPVGKLKIKEVLVGGGLIGNLPSQLRISENGNTVYTDRLAASLGGYAEMKIRFETNFGVWIEPSLRMVFQEFNSTEPAVQNTPVLDGSAIQVALALVLPF
jgi:hypothetical protein